jgi:hypothetical protein
LQNQQVIGNSQLTIMIIVKGSKIAKRPFDRIGGKA